ncbi:MAG: hypothetical protein RJB38_2263 [Pseudomonadota bacterium]|jgi:predicted DNA binding CopG/RHH family protein
MKKKPKLDQFEKELEQGLERGDWQSLPKSEVSRFENMAKQSAKHRKREARVNIRMTQGDVDVMRQLAEEEGLGYQTLMSSVLHKYASGKLVEKSMLDKVAAEIASRVQAQPRKKVAG